MRNLLITLLIAFFLVGCQSTSKIKVEKEIGLLKQIQDRGYLVCGVNADLPGFSAKDED